MAPDAVQEREQSRFAWESAVAAVQLERELG